MGGWGQGAECPQRFLTGTFFADVLGKKEARKKKRKRGENWEEKKENCKTEGRKLEMEVGKVIKSVVVFFFFFFFLLFTFENDENLFWVYQNGKFLPGKNISCREKNDFAPSEKYDCYAPAHVTVTYGTFCCMESHIFCLQSSGAWSSFTKVNPPLWILQPSC